MNSTTAWHPSVDTALFMLIHSITPPPIARPIITAPIHILVVLVCLPSHIRRKCRNLVPLMERWEDLCMDCSWFWFINRHPSELRSSYGTPAYSPSLREVQPHHTFQTLLILVVLACLQSPTPQVSPDVLHRLEYKRPPQYELQPQSVIPGDPHLNDPATSSVTHPSVIRFPSYGTLIPTWNSFSHKLEFQAFLILVVHSVHTGQ